MDVDWRAVGGLFGAAAAALGSWVGGSHKGKADYINSVNNFLVTMQAEVQHLTDKADKWEERHEQCLDAHEKCEASVKELKRQIDELMNGPIAPYELK